jgi:hypothetical protein
MECWEALMQQDIRTFAMRADWMGDIIGRKSQFESAGLWDEVLNHVVEGLPDFLLCSTWDTLDGQVPHDDFWQGDSILAHLPLIRERLERYIPLHNRLAESGHSREWDLLRTNHTYYQCLNYYHETEEYLVWLLQCRKAVREDTDVLVRWALDHATLRSELSEILMICTYRC